jgi:RNA polymerase sigma-70 factor (ECF subfamily)
MPHPAVTSQQISAVFKAESGRVLATLIRHLGDFDLAGEALQNAFVVAVDRLASRRRTGKPTSMAGVYRTAQRD